MHARVAVILPVHRDGPEVRACLDGLGASRPRPQELVVVVDGADPDLVALASRHADVVVPVARRGGPARARNLGATRASAPWLLFVDADVVVRPDTVGRVAAWAETDEVDAVIGSYDDAPPAPGVLSAYKNLLNHHHHQHARTEAETFWGACGAIRRTTFETLGGFDADRFPEPSVEDIDLGYRLTAAGGRIVVDPDLQVTHLKRWTAASLLRTDVRDRALPWAALLLERGGFQEDLNVDAVHRAKVAATIAALGVALVGGAPGRLLAAVLLALVAVADRSLLGLLWRRGGPTVAVGGYAWHLLSYCYSGAAFALALARHRRTVAAPV